MAKFLAVFAQNAKSVDSESETIANLKSQGFDVVQNGDNINLIKGNQQVLIVGLTMGDITNDTQLKLRQSAKSGAWFAMEAM